MRSIVRRLGLASCLLLAPAGAQAADFNVGNSDAYVFALIDIARNPGRTDTLNFTGSFAITAIGLPSLAKDAGQSLTVNGNGFAITSSTVRPFFIDSGVVNISNLTVSNALARGGAGGTGYGGGGGGLGAGGALFVNAGAQVTLDNVNFTNNTARGGVGGAGTSAGVAGGGGGGLGGAGGSAGANTGGGGGGGLYGAGGTATGLGAGGGGGEVGAGGPAILGGGAGGGRFGNGGSGAFGAGGGGGVAGNGGNGVNGGGGGGATGNGASDTAGLGGAGAAGGGGDGTTISSGVPGGNATSADGGGGGSGGLAVGGNGGLSGGGGGGGVGAGASDSSGGAGGAQFGGGGGSGRADSGPGRGGSGGRFGGGGGGSGQQNGAASASGGTSSEFGGGGGGGRDTGTGGSRGGNGGVNGGGGGGGGIGAVSRAGNGGFGAGGGGINELTGAGAGGAFGGNGATSAGGGTGGGGGGAGLGGAIFVAQGGQLIVRGLNLSGNSVMAGTGTGGGGNGQKAGAGIFLRNQSLTIDVAPGTSARVAEEISGTGANAGLVKQGAGTLELTGAHTYPGLTSITAGQLTVNGTLMGAVNVGAGGRLGGTGTVGATTVFGTLAPGNSIGTMTVTGPLVLSGTYEVEVDASGAADRVNVTGTTQLGGTVRVLAAPGNYTAGQRFHVISSTGAVSGAFASITDDLAAFNVRALVIGNDVFLELFRLAVGFTPNQIALESALTLGRTGGNADLTAVLAVLDALPEATARVALDAMAGEMYAGLPNAYLQDFANHSDTVQRRLWTVQPGNQSIAHPRDGNGVASAGGPGGVLALAAPVALPAAHDVVAGSTTAPGARLPGWRDWSAWGRAHGYEQDIDADGNAARQDIEASGATFGADRPCGERGLVGFTAGFTDLDLDVRGRAQSADIDTYRVGAYGALKLEHDWYATGIASYAHHDVRSRRQVTIGALTRNTGAAFDADGFGVYGEAGKNWRWGQVQVRPHAALRFASVDQDALAEGGAGSLDLRVNAIDQDAFTGIAGVWVTRPWMSSGGTLVVPELRLRYLHELESDGRTASVTLAGVPGAPVTIASNGAGRDAFLAGLGVTAKVQDRLAVFASYDGQFHSHADAHAGEAGVRVSW